MSDQRSARPGREDAVAAGPRGGFGGALRPRAGLSRRLTRKRLLATAPLLGAGILAGCGRSGSTERGPGRDVELLDEALDLERIAVVLYEDGGQLLDGPLTETAELFARQAGQHVSALAEAIEARGSTPAERSSRRVYRRRLKLARVNDADAFLKLAVRLENTAVLGYTQVVPELSEAELRRLFYELAENAAAHMTVLLGAAGEVQVPDAFVTGQPA